MLGFQPISAFAVSELDPDLEDVTILKLEDFHSKVLTDFVWYVEISPFQPGVDVIVVNDDVQVEVSWIQLQVPE